MLSIREKTTFSLIQFLVLCDGRVFFCHMGAFFLTGGQGCHTNLAGETSTSFNTIVIDNQEIPLFNRVFYMGVLQ